MSFLATVFNKSTQSQRYKLLARLTSYSCTVHALAISNNGHLLACGGTEGIKLWDIKSRKELTSSSHHHESRGTISCAVWAMTTKTAEETLCYGTGLGYIIFLRCSVADKTFQEISTKRLGSGFEITCLSWCSTPSEGNLCIALQSVFAVQLENTVPKSVAFADNRGIYVFRLYDGNVIKLKDEDGEIVQEISCNSVIGHAAVHLKRGVFVVDNATDGFTLYRLEGDGEPVRTFATAVPTVSVPKQVAFGEEGKTGQILETLHHADTGLVQTISTRDLHGRCTIASTSPAPGRGKTTIKIWAYQYAVQKVSGVPSGNYWSLSCILMMLTRLLALVSMIVFLLINYKDSLLDSAVNHARGYMTSATMNNVTDDLSWHVKAVMMFDEYVDVEADKEEKLMELAQEAGRDINVDQQENENDRLRAAKRDEQTKDLLLVQ
ncbi:hypothetical protein CY34DRAFT_18550 [Suillus luteus UH-Slu-Lm8-n1]|uniref:Unplaced genomic scaffold CY34scaffold_878, whole genome shotgun sequence n=1 Tax=Suillus luteus UH-Slu-Lm8-n1 TaxID=930992 RepID=A0A0D0AMC1_9AGAM|nr:hypothetical protein CY34DRAFT_18550 [Suillus luteus UH-Slu-Lm8-n1]